MDYLAWNDLFVKHFFNRSKAGREVLLYINDEVIQQLGEPYGAGVEDFIESIKKGHQGVTKEKFCQRALP